MKFIGIYHDVKKVDGGYELTSTSPHWKFWQSGDQTFLARPGDVVHCFAQIFSPTQFKDQLQARWLYWDSSQGWLSSDAIPIPVTGGREEGFRAMTKKVNFQPGHWRVQIETMDAREIGRVSFKVVQDDSLGDREVRQEVR